MVRTKTRLSVLRSRYRQSFTSPRKRNVSSMKPHIVLSVHVVRSASRPTDSIHRSKVAVVARTKGGQDDHVMQSFQKCVDRLGFAEAELNCDQEPITLDVVNALIKRCQFTALIVTATPKGSKGSLGRGERAYLTIQEQLRAFREAVSMEHKTEVGPDHVLMGWMVRHCACVVNNVQVSGARLHWRSCAIWRSVLGAKPFRGWSQIEH